MGWGNNEDQEAIVHHPGLATGGNSWSELEVGMGNELL